MPRVSKDVELHGEVRAFVSNSGGVAKAARLLGFDRSTLWRFLKTGCALEQTRLKIQAGLKRNESATNAPLRNRMEAVLDKEPVPVLGDELKVMRAFCQKMMALIDMYEHQVSLASHGASASAAGVDSSMRKG
jgi:hypothetical protein